MQGFARFLLLAGACAAMCVCAPAGAQTGELALTVFFTTDIHGALESAGHPTEPGAGRNPGGGLLRCAALIRELRAREPASLLLDAGDLFQGSPACFLTRGMALAEAVAGLGYDAFALGNHDMEWGAEQAARLYAVAGAPLLAGNAALEPGATGLVFEAYIIRTVAGVRVAVVGLTTPWIPMWLPKDLLGGLRFESSVRALRRIMPQVRRQKPDVVILLAHQGYRPYGDNEANQLNAIATAFPEFDLIIGGHTHQSIPQAGINGVAYAQAGSHACCVGRAAIRLDRESRRVLRVETGLLAVNPEIQPDSSMAGLLAPVFQQVTDYLATPVGEAGCEYASRAGCNPSTPALIGEAIARASGADVALHGALSDAVLPKGPFTRARLWQIIPYENTITLASVSAAELSLILNDAARFAGTRQQRTAWGVRQTSNTNQPLILDDGRKLAEADRVLLAVNSFDACSAGGRLPLLRATLEKPESQTRWTGINTRQALEDYALKYSPLKN